MEALLFINPLWKRNALALSEALDTMTLRAPTVQHVSHGMSIKSALQAVLRVVERTLLLKFGFWASKAYSAPRLRNPITFYV